LLKRTRPQLLVIHCLAHRLELSFKDAVKNNKQYEKVMTLLLGLYYLYKNSPKLKNGLKRTFQIFEMNQVLPTRVGGTRWLPHLHKAMNIFFKSYKVLRHHLENASHESPKAEGLCKIAGDGHVIAFLLALKEVITPLVCLSKSLQRRNISLADAYAEISTAQTLLNSAMKKDFPDIQAVIDASTFLDQDLVFTGIKPKVTVGELADSFIKKLANRMPSNPIVDATKVSNFRNWPAPPSNLTANENYGLAEIDEIKKNFSLILNKAEVDVDKLSFEWQRLKTMIFLKYGQQLHDGTLNWNLVMRGLADSDFNNIFRVIDLLLSMPPTSVANECCFSALNLAKNKRRARLSEKNLNNILTINQLSASLEDFDPKPAIENFLILPSSRSRRLAGYKKSIKKEAAQASTSAVHDESDQEEVDLVEDQNSDVDSEDDQDDHPELSEEVVNKLI
jgi:hypothetical protein